MLFDRGAAMSDKIIAPCGLDCATCPAYAATVNDDDEMREGIAKQWAAHGFTGKPEDVNCLSCMNESKPSMFGDYCGVRKCVVELGVQTCAYCDEFACPMLEKHWDFLGRKNETRANLQALRQAPDAPS
jgi:hypothetical protein